MLHLYIEFGRFWLSVRLCCFIHFRENITSVQYPKNNDEYCLIIFHSSLHNVF